MPKTSTTSLEKQVRAAAKQLITENQAVTNENIKALTGGSYRDLTPLVRQIKAEIEARAFAAREIPNAPSEFSDAAEELWRLAWEKADELAKAERQGHAKEVQKLSDEIAELEKIVGVVEIERDASITQCADLTKALQALKEKMKSAELEVARLTGRLEERQVAHGAETDLVTGQDDNIRAAEEHDAGQLALFE